MLFVITLGAAWICGFIMDVCIINPYFKYIKYPRMRKEGWIVKDGYLPYKPTDTVRVKEGYHNPFDVFGVFDGGTSLEMTPYSAQKMMEKILDEKDKWDQCIEKSRRDYKKRHGKDFYRYKENRE